MGKPCVGRELTLDRHTGAATFYAVVEMAKKSVKIKLVFSDWCKTGGGSVYQTAEGVDLSAGQFHAGTTFDAQIELEQEDADDLAECIGSGYTPVFEVMLDEAS